MPRPKALIVALLLLYFVAAVWMAFALPPHATPNELLNYEYIQVMRQIGGLPNRGLVDSDVRYTEWHQPPLYFTFAALFGLTVPVPPSADNPPPPIAWPANPHYLGTARGNLNPAVHVAPDNTPLLYTSRVAAALLGMLAVATLYTAGKRIYDPATGLLMASLLAFQPTFLHLSGSVNNDMPLTAVAAVTVAYAAFLVTRPPGRTHRVTAARYFLLGLLCAAAILTKANGVFVLAAAGIALLAGMVANNRHRSSFFSSFILPPSAFLLGLLPLWTAWLWLNTVRMADTLGLSGSLPVGRVLALDPLDFIHVAPFLPAVWRSYWLDWSAGDVGYGPDWLYALWLVGVVGMLAGWLRRPRTSGLRSADDRPQTTDGASTVVRRLWSSLQHPTTAMFAAFLAISYLYFAVKALTVKEAGWMVPEGRWWLPGLPMLAWLLAAGYRRWWSPRRRKVACLIAAAVPPLIAFGLLLAHLPALYPRAERWPAADCAPAVCPLPLLRYGDALELVAAESAPAANASLIPHPPSPILDLTWRAVGDLAADYTINTQLLAQAPDGWRKLAEHNSYPGQGMNPTGGWQAGEVYRDRLALRLDASLDGPTQAAVQVRVTQSDAPLLTGSPQPAAGASPPADLTPTRDGQPVDAPIVASVVVRPVAPLAIPDTAAASARFADAFELAAWEVAPDDGMVTLWWRATAAPPAGYTIFVHLLDAAGSVLAQADGPPNLGLSPTSIWQPGDVIRDVHTFPPGTVLPDDGVISVGAYRPDTGERVPATQDGQLLPDGAVRIVGAFR